MNDHSPQQDYLNICQCYIITVLWKVIFFSSQEANYLVDMLSGKFIIPDSQPYYGNSGTQCQ